MRLIGPNGEDKRKLMKLMISVLEPDDGNEFRNYVT